MKASTLSRLGQRIQAPPISWLMQTALAHPNVISLAAGFTDNDSLPLDATRELLARTLRSKKAGRAALQYGSTQGDPHLRRLTGAHLHRIDGQPAPEPYAPDRMIISNGSQQMLYMVTEALCDEGDIVLVEDPTYFVYLGILQSQAVEARGIRMQQDGIDLGHLESVLQDLKRSGKLPRVKALYLVTYFQNPTGITTRFEKKAEALRLLKRFEKFAGHPLYLIEDAAYRELRFKGADEPTALASGSSALSRVIYAGTYSKPFATGARVGFGLLPEPVFSAVLRIKGNHDFGTSNLLQQLLAGALASGIYDEHLVALRERYGRKASVLGRALRAHLPESVEWNEPEGGLYFWARCAGRQATGMRSALFRSALAKGVLYVPGALCYADDPTRQKPDCEMRISFGSAGESSLRTGAERLGKALRSRS